jgi:TldD protein
MAQASDQSKQGALGLFRERFGVDERGLELGLASALARAVDHADLFFEYTTRDAVSLEDGAVKSGARHLEQGVGVRVQAGERQGYA